MTKAIAVEDAAPAEVVVEAEGEEAVGEEAEVAVTIIIISTTVVDTTRAKMGRMGIGMEGLHTMVEVPRNNLLPITWRKLRHRRVHLNRRINRRHSSEQPTFYQLRYFSLYRIKKIR